MKLLTKKEVSAILNIHPITLGRWVTNGDFPAPLQINKAGRRKLLWDKDTLDKWLASVKP